MMEIYNVHIVYCPHNYLLFIYCQITYCLLLSGKDRFKPWYTYFKDHVFLTTAPDSFLKSELHIKST